MVDAATTDCLSHDAPEHRDDVLGVPVADAGLGRHHDRANPTADRIRRDPHGCGPACQIRAEALGDIVVDLAYGLHAARIEVRLDVPAPVPLQRRGPLRLNLLLLRHSTHQCVGDVLRSGRCVKARDAGRGVDLPVGVQLGQACCAPVLGPSRGKRVCGSRFIPTVPGPRWPSGSLPRFRGRLREDNPGLGAAAERMDRQLAGLVDAIAAGEQRGTAARERAATALADPAVTRAVRDDEESKAVDAGDGSILRRVSR